MRLFLIRHGQTPSNVAGALDTAFPGAGLTPLGQLQAQALPDALVDEEISGIYASPLVRTQLTSIPLAEARHLQTRVLEGLAEVSAGDLEMREDPEAVRMFADCTARWMRGDLAYRLPGGTTGRGFYERFDAALRAITDEHGPDETIAVFSHGAAIRCYTALAVRLDPEVATELRIMNTGTAVLEGAPEKGWELARWSTEPLGGLELEDLQAHDVTGESAEEAMHEA
jgi:broad specificity phosphatase PhoE